jgi:hypothetical protein
MICSLHLEKKRIKYEIINAHLLSQNSPNLSKSRLFFIYCISTYLHVKYKNKTKQNEKQTNTTALKGNE